MKEQTTEYETGSYNIFDPIQWRKVSCVYSLYTYRILGSEGNEVGIQNVRKQADARQSLSNCGLLYWMEICRIKLI
jgi:hypothetical protein